MAEPTPDRVVEAYMKTRADIEQLKAELEAKIQPLKELQERRESWLMEAIKKSGLKNLPTLHGTAYINKTESITCADWDVFIDWVKQNDAYEFLERRVAKTPVLEIMGEDRTNLPPPGTNYTSILKIGVRKA